MQLLTNEQMHFVDNQAMQVYHISSRLLMEHASYGIYEKMKMWLNMSDTIQIVCGVGNNGGDGLVLARLLALDGYHVCYSLVNGCVVTQDALDNLRIVEAMGIRCTQKIEQVTVLVDAIFGTGFREPVSGEIRHWIASMNASKAKKVSIDIPSGVHCNTGTIKDIACMADITYTIARGKIGLYVYPGSAYAGKVEVVDLHVPHVLFDTCGSWASLLDYERIRNWLPVRKKHSHKGDYGKLLLVGGSQNMSGAISLAARAALASGCGLLTCAVPQTIQNVIQTNVLESMSMGLQEEDGYLSLEGLSQIHPANYDCALIGCGIGRVIAITEYVRLLLESELPLVIDADGLVALKPLMSLYRHRHDVILTPHIKEFADLMDLPLQKVVDDRMDCVKMFMELYPNWTLVLKSETTIVVHHHEVYINVSGNNGLAVGGSGDVLAGMIVGFLGQGKDVLKASCCGVYLHGYTADRLLKSNSVYSILPTKLIDQLEEVLFELTK